jgi:hypothetical protein
MKYNQIKGKEMKGLIAESKLYRIDVDGNGQSVYYPADDKTCGHEHKRKQHIILYMANNKIRRITFVKSPVGNLSPLLTKVDPESRLEGFLWRGEERPIDKFDIFRDKNGAANPAKLPDSEIDTILPKVEGLRDKKMEEYQQNKLE